MTCQKCNNLEKDTKESLVLFITGHHPSCPAFVVDKDRFLEEFEAHVELGVARRIFKEIEDIKNNKIEDITNEEEFSIKTTQLVKRLYLYLSSRYFPVANNSYIFNWESDLLALNKDSKYITEYEIKVSKTDFKADFKKDKKHHQLLQCFMGDCQVDSTPNYFYYVTPPSLIRIEDIPEYSGLIEIGSGVNFIKKAPILHKNKMEESIREQLLQKVYYKYWNNEK